LSQFKPVLKTTFVSFHHFHLSISILSHFHFNTKKYNLLVGGNKRLLFYLTQLTQMLFIVAFFGLSGKRIAEESTPEQRLLRSAGQEAHQAPHGGEGGDVQGRPLRLHG
jgi:hypothetical protein